VSRRRKKPLPVLPEGVRLGVDVGSVRIGVAVSDPAAHVALPLEVVPADRYGGSDVARIAELAAAYAVVEVVVGLPLTLRGEEGAAAAAARSFGDRLVARVAPARVRFVDERLSTVTAAASLRASGVSTRQGRGTVDAAAAAVLLQAALDTDRAARASAAATDLHDPIADRPRVEP
jgi:putative holliday junction resolvase